MTFPLSKMGAKDRLNLDSGRQGEGKQGIFLRFNWKVSYLLRGERAKEL